ncbi:hypothetical protein [Flavobacterium sp. 3HN19-14]|uniref:hypothetical protein n=1 Tax=Flavobacterium sp. 3HN19-14 TaxID=3448133 RepID=UPI003EE1A46E
MDSNYVINRLKNTLYKYPTVELLRTRLKNVDADTRETIVHNLKIELWKHRNADIHEPLFELLHKMPLSA